MKYYTSTPSFLSLIDGESQKIGSVECPAHCDFHRQQHRQQHRSSNAKISPSPSILSTETRRVSTASCFSTESSSGLSCISSSESSSSSTSSIGFRTYDDTYDTAESTSSFGEDDPIISFEALSLDTQRITLGVTTTPTLEAKTVLVEEEQYHQHKQEKTFGGVMRGMNQPQKQEQDRNEPSIESLSLAVFEEKDMFSLSRRPNSHSIRGQQLTWERKSLETINIVPCAESSDDTSVRPVSFPQEENHQQQRRTPVKKYTVKTTMNAIRSTSITEVEYSRVSRTKRERGGSDFTMASASGVGDATNSSSNPLPSPLSRRKRRRMNRNRAMAADDFDSILSQINTPESL